MWASRTPAVLLIWEPMSSLQHPHLLQPLRRHQPRYQEDVLLRTPRSTQRARRPTEDLRGWCRARSARRRTTQVSRPNRFSGCSRTALRSVRRMLCTWIFGTWERDGSAIGVTHPVNPFVSLRRITQIRGRTGRAMQPVSEAATPPLPRRIRLSQLQPLRRHQPPTEILLHLMSILPHPQTEAQLREKRL